MSPAPIFLTLNIVLETKLRHVIYPQATHIFTVDTGKYTMMMKHEKCYDRQKHRTLGEARSRAPAPYPESTMRAGIMPAL